MEEKNVYEEEECISEENDSKENGNVKKIIQNK